MMTHSTHTKPHTGKHWWSPFIESLTVALIVLMFLQPASPAIAADCFVDGDTLPVQDMPGWEASTPTLPMHSVTVTRDCLCGLFPYLTNSRLGSSKAGTLGITALAACLPSTSEKSALLADTGLCPIRPVNARAQTLRVSTVSYNNKKHMLKIPTTLPEFKRAMTSAPSTAIIGPVQTFQGPPSAGEQNLTQTIPTVPPLDSPFSLFSTYHWGPLNQFQGLQQLPNGEVHRMNTTTSLVFHGGKDCMNDCP